MIQAQLFARDWRRDPQRAGEDLQECLRLHSAGEPGGIDPSEFSLKDMAAEFVMEGDRAIGLRGVDRLYNPRGVPISLTEGTLGVDSTTFSNITGQLLISKIMAAYMSEEFVASRLVETVPTRLDGEKIPGISNISDPGQDALTVQEGEEFPRAGFSEDFVETPATTKRGMIVPITKEAIFFDRTNLVLTRAGTVGNILGINKEKRILDMIIGGTKTYKRKGVDFFTYYSKNDGSTRPWTNHLSGNELVDWTDIDNAENLFSELLDPNTSEPIVLGGRQLLTPWQLRSTATRIISATEIRHGASSSPQTISSNPLGGLGISLSSSRQLYQRLIATDAFGHSVSAANAKGYWWYGDFRKAFAYMENWPITVIRAPQNSTAEFNQDIVAQFKASERGAAAIMEPRAVVRSRADSTSSSSGS